MHVVVKIMSVIILYWKNVFFFFAYCFIIPDIELGIYVVTKRKRLPIQSRVKFMNNLRRC